MKEKRFMKDWATETRLDPASGKEKRTAVYQGVWYQYGPAGGDKSGRILWAALPWALYLALILLYFLLDFPGATILYVFLPAALSLFPALYWAMGAYQVWRGPERMTRLQKETGPDRVLRSSAGCGILALAAVVGDGICLLTGQAGPRELPGLALLLTAACAAYAAMRYFSRISREMAESKEERK